MVYTATSDSVPPKNKEQDTSRQRKQGGRGEGINGPSKQLSVAPS